MGIMNSSQWLRALGLGLAQSATCITLAAGTGTMAVGLLVTPIGYAEEVKAPEVTFEELKGFVAKKSAVLVDANGTSTYKEGHIPGAIDFEKHEADLGKVLPKDKKTLIVAYCGGPLCVAWESAAKKLKTLGYTNVKHFKGGLKGWKDSGQALSKS
jgi:rhodanese-related sulfurtransferase